MADVYSTYEDQAILGAVLTNDADMVTTVLLLELESKPKKRNAPVQRGWDVRLHSIERFQRRRQLHLPGE